MRRGFLLSSSSKQNDAATTTTKANPPKEQHQQPACSPTLSSEKSEKVSTLTSNTPSPKSKKEKADDDYRAHLSDHYETPSKVTGLHFGEQLTDDLLNSFCDKVQAAVDEPLEGFMAIQTVHLTPELIPSLITGTKRVLQIILDSHRKHYILFEWNPANKERGVLIYDPLIQDSEDMEAVLNNSFRCQFHRLFDHLYPSKDNGNDGVVPCKMESFTYAQNDNWSCGLRAAALLVLRAFNGTEQLHGGEIYIDIRRFHHILKAIMRLDVKATKEDFHIYTWFHKASHPYKFLFFNIPKCDSIVNIRYQNFCPDVPSSYVESDENDDIPKIQEALLQKKKYRSKIGSDGGSYTGSSDDNESDDDDNNGSDKEDKDSDGDDDDDNNGNDNEKIKKTSSKDETSQCTSSTSTTKTDDGN